VGQAVGVDRLGRDRPIAQLPRPARRRPQRRGADGIDRLCGQLVSVAVTAMLDGSWERLKACRNCRWAFFDESKNRSAHWCSMSLCGNRLKTRAYRRRQRSAH